MAYDEDPTSATFPWEVIPNSAVLRSQFTPIGFDLEPELKFELSIPRKFLIQTAGSAPQQLAYIQELFLLLAQTFQRPDPREYSFIAAEGITPRDYVLTNLGQDTGQKYGNWILPQCYIHNNGYQYRERFAVPVFAGISFNEVAIRNFDANAKTLLSAGRHRKEFETKNDPTICAQNSFDKFRQVPHLPEFFHGISADSLYVIKTWMTSRSTLFTLSQIPETGLYVLCEHCCDVTRYATGNFDHFINGGRDDPEWETEIKGFYGVDQRLETEDGQVELIDMVFADIFRRFREVTSDVRINVLSKMERARNVTEGHYAPNSTYKDCATTNNPFAKLLENVGVGIGLSHVFLQANTARKITDAEHLPRIISLASQMINPRDIIDARAIRRHVLLNQPSLAAA